MGRFISSQNEKVQGLGVGLAKSRDSNAVFEILSFLRLLALLSSHLAVLLGFQCDEALALAALFWPCLVILKGRSRSFRVVSAKVSQRNLTGLVWVTCPSFNQSVAKRICSDRWGLSHVSTPVAEISVWTPPMSVKQVSPKDQESYCQKNCQGTVY